MSKMVYKAELAEEDSDIVFDVVYGVASNRAEAGKKALAAYNKSYKGDFEMPTLEVRSVMCLGEAEFGVR